MPTPCLCEGEEVEKKEYKAFMLVFEHCWVSKPVFNNDLVHLPSPLPALQSGCVAHLK